MNKNRKLVLFTVLIVVGILINYLYQFSPSPFMLTLREYFNLGNNNVMLNLLVSIIYPFIIIASIAGGLLEPKIGTKNLYTLTLVFLCIGMLMNYIATTCTTFLIGRALSGIGGGLFIPFFGSAVMQYYNEKQRELMNTMNAAGPFLATLIGFAILTPLFILFDQSWQRTFGVWGIMEAVVLVVWVLFAKEQQYIPSPAAAASPPKQEVSEKGVYRHLWQRKDIRMIAIAFVVDFVCYSYVAMILPTFLQEAGNMKETAAGLWAAIAFPGACFVGCLGGYAILAASGLRKPTLVLGQILKLFGLCFATVGATVSAWLIVLGVIIYSIGAGMWMPGCFIVPCELPEMTPPRVGAAFSLIISLGMLAGFFASALGGWLTNRLMILSGIANQTLAHAFGLQWSLFMFGLCNIICLLCMLKLTETGTATNK